MGVDDRRDGLHVGLARPAVAAGRIGVDAGIEASLEEADELRHDRGVAGEGGLDVALAEGQAHLAEVLGVRPQQVDLSSRQASDQDQLVQTVALQLPSEQCREGGAELVPHLELVDALGIGDPQADVVPPDAAALDADLVRPFVHDRDTQVFQQGEHLGEQEGRAGPHEREANLLRCGSERAVQGRDDVPAGFDLEQAGDVAGRHGRRVGIAVVGWERLSEAGQRGKSGVLPELPHQRRAQLVGPVGDDGAQPLLHVGDERAAHVLPQRNADVQAGQRAHPDQDLVLGAGPAEDLAERFRDALRPIRRVAVPGQVDEARDEPAVVVEALEQPDLAPILQLEDARRDLEQLAGVDLEQLVARVGLQDLAQRPPAVALRREAGPVQHLRGLLPQQRDVQHAVAVDVGVEQAEEPPLPDHPPVAVEPLHPDVGEVVGAADGAAAVGRGEQQHRGRQHHPPRLRRDVRQPVRLLGPAPIAQQAQAGAGHCGDHVLVSGVVCEVVLPVAEEDEVVVAQPAQELSGPGRLAGPQRQDAVLQLVRELVTAVPHRAPVLDGHPHVVQGVEQPLAEHLLASAVAAIDLQVHPGLVGRAVLDPLVAAVVPDDAQHRMDDQVDAEPHGRHHHAHRVDQERHVVGDDLHHGVWGLPSRRSQVRVEHVQVGRSLDPHLAQAEVGERGAEQVTGLSGLEVGPRQVLEVAAHKAVAAVLQLWGELAVGQLEHGAERAMGGALPRDGSTSGPTPPRSLVGQSSGRRAGRGCASDAEPSPMTSSPFPFPAALAGALAHTCRGADVDVSDAGPAWALPSLALLRHASPDRRPQPTPRAPLRRRTGKHGRPCSGSATAWCRTSPSSSASPAPARTPRWSAWPAWPGSWPGPSAWARASGCP